MPLDLAAELFASAPVSNPSGGGGDNVKRFLDFLGKAEGADYNTLVGGSKFDDLSAHPNKIGLRTANGPSTAAGKYQITKTTYDDFARRLGITDFSPESQDRIAKAIIEKEGALGDVEAGNFNAAIAKLGGRWASLPSSKYGQPTRSAEWVRNQLGATDEQPISGKTARAMAEHSYGSDVPLFEAPSTRGWGEAAADTGAAALKGVGNLSESLGGLYGLVTGDVDPNIAQTGGKALSDYAESLKSEFIKNKEQISQEQIANADGMLNQFATAAWNNISDPALLVNTMAEQAANFVPGMAAGRMARGLIAGLGGATSAAAFDAATTAEKAMMIKRLATAGKVGTGVSVVTGAIMQGADAGNSAFQQISARPQAEWDADPEYQRLVTTLGVKGAKDKIALDESRAAFSKSALVSLGLNSVGPTHAIDKMLVNGGKNRVLSEAERAMAGKIAGQGTLRTAASGAAKSFAGEAVSESLDEGYGQYAANVAEARINQNKNLTDEVGANAGLGFAFGPMGAVGGTLDALGRKKAAEEAVAASDAKRQADLAKENSPLMRAAAASAPAIESQAQADHEQARANDPLAQDVAAIGERLSDRAFYDSVRQHENLGPQALSDILASYRVASNYNLDIKQRQAAVERLNEFFQLYDNQPNFTMGANGEPSNGGSIVPAGQQGVVAGKQRENSRPGVPTYDVGAAPQLGFGNKLLTEQEQKVVSAAEAEYEAAYADLIKAEQLGASDQELMQKQIAARQAEARLQEIHQAIDGNRQQETAAKRDALLNQVLDVIPPDQNPNRAFDRALKAAGFTDTAFSEGERAKIAQWQQLSDSFRAEQEREASAPNQLDAEAMGIKSKSEPQAQGQAGARLREVEAMLNAGMVRRGDRMEDPRTGRSVKLSPAQIARAKHLEKTSERERVLPAYEQAIAQRTAELQRLIQDPNHDEGQAVRLSRAITGLKGIVSALKKGASLDDAIASTLGNVPNEVKAALKNPRRDDGAEPAAEIRQDDPVRPNRGGGSVLPPAELERAHKYAAELRSMAPDAGWAEIGGRLIRDNKDNATSRTKWIPRAEWFVAGMLNSPKASEEAVRKAIAGEPMLKPERLHVMGMMDFLDAHTGAEQAFIDALDTAISEDSDFGLPDYSAETAAVVELEFSQGSVDVPAFLEAIGANDEENHVTQDEKGAGQAGGAATGQSQEDGQGRQDAPGAGRTGPQSEGFGLTGQTNEEAAAEHAQQQAGDTGAITKEQADKERDAVPFSMQMQSQPKPQGTQVGLFTADGRPSVAAKQEEPAKANDWETTKSEQAAVKSFLKPGDVITQGGWIGVIRDKSIPNPRDGFQFDNPEHGWYIAMHDVDGTKRRGMNKERNTQFMFVRDGALFDSPMPGWPPTQLHVFDSMEKAKAWVKSNNESLAAKHRAKQEAKPFDEDARAKERQTLYEKTRAEAQADPRRTEELSKVMPAFDAETERMRKAALSQQKNDSTEDQQSDKASAPEAKDDMADASPADEGDIEQVADNKGPEVKTLMTDGTFKQWQRAVRSLGKVNGWTLFKDDIDGEHYVLMTSYNSVGFDTEQEARNWAKDNKAVKGDFNRRDEVAIRERLEEMSADDVVALAKAMGITGKHYGTQNIGLAIIDQKAPKEIIAAIDAMASEPNLAAAKALIQEAKDTHGDKRKEAIVRKKARELAQKTPLSDEKTVLALDMVSTRLGMGDGGTKALEFLPAVENAQKPAATAEYEAADDGEALANDFRTYPTKVLSAVIDSGQASALYKAAGVRSADAFSGLPISEQADAYAKFVQDGGTKVEGLPADYNEWVRSQEADAESRRMQSERTIRQANGKPFKTEASAQQAIERFGLTETHDVKPVEGGFELQQLTPAAQLERRRKAEGKESYIEAQEAVMRQLGIEANSEGEYDLSEAQWADVERRVDARLRGEQGSEQLGDIIDYERFVLISADDISKLRKIDVERVLEQGAVKEFRQEFADWIKAKRPDLAQEVDAVLADIAPAMTYDQFKAEMQRLFSLANKYKPGEIGFNEYSAKMADLSDAHPEFSERLDEENDGAQMAGQASDAEGLKAQRAKLFQAAENAAQKRLQDEIPNYERRKSREGVARFNKLRQEEQLKRQSQIDAIQKKIDRLDGGIAPTAAPSSDMDDLKAQMAQAVDELAAILGIKTNLTPEEESQLIPVMAKMFRIAAKMSFVKFKDAARWVLDTIRAQSPETADKLSIDNLQAGYINIAKEIGGNKRDALDIESIDDLYAVDPDMQERIEAAKEQTNHDATPAQKEAGNYAKGKFPWNGLTVSVETAKGEDRTDKETNGKKWRVTMPATYGYILGTKGADGDHVDVFMGDKPDSGAVYVINQTQPDVATFDEHKVMLGYSNEADAKADYLASFSNGFGKKVFGSLEGPFSVDEFKRLLADGELEAKSELDYGRRLDDSTPLSDITVTVEAVEAETGRAVEMDEQADEALKDVDDRMNLARSLLECLAS